MGEAKRRGSYDRRKENPKGTDYKIKQGRFVRVNLSDLAKRLSYKKA